jgi:hypothetical protein
MKNEILRSALIAAVNESINRANSGANTEVLVFRTFYVPAYLSDVFANEMFDRGIDKDTLLPGHSPAPGTTDDIICGALRKYLNLNP